VEALNGDAEIGSHKIASLDERERETEQVRKRALGRILDTLVDHYKPEPLIIEDEELTRDVTFRPEDTSSGLPSVHLRYPPNEGPIIGLAEGINFLNFKRNGKGDYSVLLPAGVNRFEEIDLTKLSTIQQAALVVATEVISAYLTEEHAPEVFVLPGA